MNVASLFDLAGSDLFVILIIVLLLFGAKKLPGLFQNLGQAFREFLEALTGLDGPSEDGQRAHLTNRVLLLVAVLAGIIFIAVAMEH